MYNTKLVTYNYLYNAHLSVIVRVVYHQPSLWYNGHIDQWKSTGWDLLAPGWVWLYQVITSYKLSYLPQDLQRSKQWGLPPLVMESNRPLNASWQSNFIDHKSVSGENAFLTILIKPSIL